MLKITMQFYIRTINNDLKILDLNSESEVIANNLGQLKIRKIERGKAFWV